MKKLLTLLSVLLLVSGVHAATIVTVESGANTNSIVTGRIKVSSVQVANATGGALTFTMKDAPSTNETYTNAAYTTSTSYTTNLVTSYTNIFGVAISQTNEVLYTIDQSVSASTNNYETITTISAAAGATVTWTPTAGMFLDEGLLGISSGALTITTTYTAQ